MQLRECTRLIIHSKSSGDASTLFNSIPWLFRLLFFKMISCDLRDNNLVWHAWQWSRMTCVTMISCDMRDNDLVWHAWQLSRVTCVTMISCDMRDNDLVWHAWQWSRVTCVTIISCGHVWQWSRMTCVTMISCDMRDNDLVWHAWQWSRVACVTMILLLLILLKIFIHMNKTYTNYAMENKYKNHLCNVQWEGRGRTKNATNTRPWRVNCLVKFRNLEIIHD